MLNFPPPALTQDQWDLLTDYYPNGASDNFRHNIEKLGWGIELQGFGGVDAAGLMAVCNFALPEGDKRKITWEHVEALETIARKLPPEKAFGHVSLFAELAMALRSMLPPRE